MAQKAAAKTTRINRATPVPAADIERYCRNLNGGPRSWMGLEKDLQPGEHLVACFRPFLKYLTASELSPKTIQKHVDNMWALGGEFIRDLNDNPALRKRPVDQILFELIEYGGSLLYHGEEDQQRSFDSTCRKFRRFLADTAR
jgi:hypothetical protein